MTTSIQIIQSIDRLSEIWEYKTPVGDLPLWLLMRWDFAKCLGDRIYKTTFFGAQTQVKRRQILHRLVNKFRTNLFDLKARAQSMTLRDCDWMFFASASFHRTIGGVVVGTLVDPLAEMCGNSTVVIEPQAGLLGPRSFARTYPIEGFEALAAASGFSAKELQELDDDIDQLFKLLHPFAIDIFSDADRNKLRQGCIREAKRAMSLYRYFDKRFVKLRPKAIFVEDGHYGSWSGLIAAAHDRGILVVEPQHGMIVGGHEAYNYARQVHEHVAFQRSMPNVLLTFGAYWESQLSTSARVVNIGNAIYSQQIEEVRGIKLNQNRIRVLVISSMICEDGYHKVLKELENLPNDFEVLYRPHPKERSIILERYEGYFRQSNSRIRLDSESNLYRSLAEARIVLGDISTCLFETYGFEGQEVFYIDHEETRRLLGSDLRFFKNVEDITNLELQDRDEVVVHENPYFSLDWEERFRVFLGSV